MSTKLSQADSTKLSAAQQSQIKKLKQDWEKANAAGDTAGMKAANQKAEAIRATAGYSGGSDGSGDIKLPTGGGKSAGEVKQWVDDYYYTNLDQGRGWINGYSEAMNLRSVSNYIRQQLQANSQAWADADEAGKQYLHEQNKQLAKLLSDAVGGVQSTFNETLGRWETDNPNLGYGYDTGSYKNENWFFDHYGVTPEELEVYRNDTDRYRNYVDQSIIRFGVDETGGYTGQYAQFINGPYGQLLPGTYGVNAAAYTDLLGDGFYDEAGYAVKRDAEGNFIKEAPKLKNNNAMTDYTKQFNSYVDENGIIQPGKLVQANPGGGTMFGGRTSRQHTYRQPKEETVNATGTLEQWKNSAMAMAAASHDRAVDQAVQQLLMAQAQAQEQYRTQQDQIAREERQALDNSALYAETRGDRGGIGRSQYDHIQAQADANRQTVSNAQVQLATDTARQIAQLRANGEFEKAEDMMQISQTYLLKLLDMEQWAAEQQLDVEKFRQSVRQWESEYRLELVKAMI